MEINDIVLDLKKMTNDLMDNYCIINGAFLKLSDVKNMGLQEFAKRCRYNMPIKLYKYCNNKDEIIKGETINYSIQALKNNTIFMQTPMAFDDVFDSEINLDYCEYIRLSLIDYCKRCLLPIDIQRNTDEIGNVFVEYLYKTVCKDQSFDNIFKKIPNTEMEKLSNELFIKQLQVELNSNNDLGKVVSKIIHDKYNDKIKELKTAFRTACFSTTPYSQLMWGGNYANFHKGFCIEYTIISNDEKYNDIYYNLYPMIYSKARSDITKFIVNHKSIDDEYLWNIYFNGALRKSIDWAYQNEWRLLLPINSKNTKDFNVKFFPITKVYLGNRMISKERKKIIEICKEKRIPYVGVKRNQNYFEMIDCEIKCEDCYNYKFGLENDN